MLGEEDGGVDKGIHGIHGIQLVSSTSYEARTVEANRINGAHVYEGQSDSEKDSDKGSKYKRDNKQQIDSTGDVGDTADIPLSIITTTAPLIHPSPLIHSYDPEEVVLPRKAFDRTPLPV